MSEYERYQNFMDVKIKRKKNSREREREIIKIPVKSRWRDLGDREGRQTQRERKTKHQLGRESAQRTEPAFIQSSPPVLAPCRVWNEEIKKEFKKKRDA